MVSPFKLLLVMFLVLVFVLMFLVLFVVVLFPRFQLLLLGVCGGILLGVLVFLCRLVLCSFFCLVVLGLLLLS